METKRNVVIFFDDLKEDAQERIIATEMWDIIKTDREPAIRSIRIDQNVYGYDLNAVMAQMVAEIIRVKDFEWIELG